LLINGWNGAVKVQCMATKCKGKNRRLKRRLLPEQVDTIFPPRLQQQQTQQPWLNKRPRAPDDAKAPSTDQPPKKRAKVS